MIGTRTGFFGHYAANLESEYASIYGYGFSNALMLLFPEPDEHIPLFFVNESSLNKTKRSNFIRSIFSLLNMSAMFISAALQWASKAHYTSRLKDKLYSKY